MSHAERMQNPDACVKDYKTDYVAHYSLQAKEQVVENGRIVNTTVWKDVDPVQMLKGYKASDFALENIIAAGALDSLKEGQLHVNGGAELSDHMEGVIDNVNDAVDAYVNVEPQNNEGE